MKHESHWTTLETKWRTRLSTVCSGIGRGEATADLVQKTELRRHAHDVRLFAFIHVSGCLLRALIESFASRASGATPFGRLLHEDSHLRVDATEIHRQALSPKFLGRHGTDRDDDTRPARPSVLLPAHVRRDIQEMKELDTGESRIGTSTLPSTIARTAARSGSTSSGSAQLVDRHARHRGAARLEHRRQFGDSTCRTSGLHPRSGEEPGAMRVDHGHHLAPGIRRGAVTHGARPISRSAATGFGPARHQAHRPQGPMRDRPVDGPSQAQEHAGAHAGHQHHDGRTRGGLRAIRSRMRAASGCFDSSGISRTAGSNDGHGPRNSSTSMKALARDGSRGSAHAGHGKLACGRRYALVGPSDVARARGRAR